MAAPREMLLEREEELWKGRGDVYRDRLTDDALVLVPGAVLTKDETVAAIEASPRWVSVDIDDARTVELAEDGVIVTYRATARRDGDGDPYSAVVASAYVWRDGDWRLAFHQQTPLPG